MDAARPYALAAFSFAVEGDAVDAWDDALRRLTEISKQIKIALDGKLATDAQVCGIILQVATMDDAQKNFLRVLAENDRLNLLPQITAVFSRLKLEGEGVLPVRVETAMAFSAAQQKEFADYLQKRFAKKVTVDYAQNPDLLGGVRIYARDDVIDASIRGRLDSLATAMGARRPA